MTPELRTDTFDDWLRFAERASDDSVAARREALKAPLDDDEGFASAVQREFEAAMIAVSASAFALDAFFASVVEHAPEARVSVGSRHATIYETFKRARSAPNSRAEADRGVRAEGEEEVFEARCVTYEAAEGDLRAALADIRAVADVDQA